MEINEEVIEKLLIEKDDDKSIKVKKILLEPAVGKGENFMSVAMKIQVQGTKFENNKVIDFSKSLFMKKQFESKETTEMLESDKIFGNEALTYTKIIPVLEEYFGEPMPVAKCYSADEKHLILEDLFATGYSMIEGQKSLTIEQCCAVLEELAKLHSASYILKSKNGNKFVNLSKKIFEMFSNDNKTMPIFCAKSFDNTIKQLKMVKPETTELKTIIEKFEEMKSTIYNDVVQLLETKTTTDIFNHGDCWMNNLLFKKIQLTAQGAKPNNPYSVKLVDLQIMRTASPAADLSYFLNINLFPALRKEKIDYLLKFYLKHLHTNLKKHNLTDQIKILDLTWLKKEMVRFSKFGLMFGLMIFPIFYINRQELPEMENITKEINENSDENIGKWMEKTNNKEYHNALVEFLKLYFEEYDA